MQKKRSLSKGMMEAAVSDAMIKFEKEFMGRGPLETKTYIIDDMVLVRMKGILTKAEIKLVKSDRKSKGRELIKQVKVELIENGRALLESAMKSITKRKVKSLHTDISTVSGEKIVVFIMDKEPEFL